MSSNHSRSSQSQSESRTNPSGASTPTTPRTRKSTPYDAAFEQGLIDSGIYPHGYEYPDDSDAPRPSNIAEINKRLAQSRESLSPSKFTDADFRKFEKANMRAGSEAEMMSNVFPIIKGNAAIPSGQNRLFKNFAPLNKGLADAKPDYYNGSRPVELDSRVRSDLGPYIVPSKRQHAPLLPNFFMEAKGPDGSAAVLKRQATQDIAYGARAMLEIQSYWKDARTYDGNAYTIASTYNNGNLRLYAAHPTQPTEPSGRANYHMTQLTGYDMTGNSDSFRQGATAFRNMQGWAKEQRREAIAGANEKVSDMYGGTTATLLAGPGLVSFTSEVSALVSETSLGETHESQSQDSTQNEASYTSETVRQESETSMDEPVIDANPPTKRSRHRRRSTSGSSARQSSAAAGIHQSEQWSWADGAFRCLQGRTVVRTQNEKPADVWVYCKEGWPGEGGKQWRRWLSVTDQMEYH
jgi:hypothetical protein